MEDPSLYIGILICLLFSAFFSGIEIAFISADKLHIEVMSKKGTFTGKILSEFVTKKSHFLATMLVGNNLSIVLYGILMAKLLEPWLYDVLPPTLSTDVVILVSQSLLSTIIVLITAEFLPKSLFMLNPDTMLTVFALPMAAIYFILFPVVWLITGVSRFIITKGLRFDYSEDKPVYGLTDLNNYIKKNILNIEQEEEPEIDAKIFNNAIEFKTIRVRECMIPRTEIVAVDVNDDIEELKEEFIESGHSKILVYKESIDEVIGYCHSLELFKKPEKIKDILTSILIVPETMLANELLIQFITERKSIALVVDEYGGTSGIVTMEDVIEEIFGEIRDEHDDEYLEEEQIDDHNYILSARHEVDYLNDKYNWELPVGEYDTLGGLILAFHEDIPSVNEAILIPPFHFTIFTMEENRIDKVKLTILDKEEAL
ncbi:hemolysin family protein [Marinoscillum sp.]|uniref:hemolysin family protein n=1 Tax=Marinoscillum sp. TaxID=2024838 RepID=UPI003BAA6386